MGSLFRSEEMSLIQLFIQFESAHAVVSELGELGMVQFRDLNPEANAFQRKFVREIRRCEEMERKLRFIDQQVELAGLKVEETEMILDTSDRTSQDVQTLEEKLNRLDAELQHMNRNEEVLQKNFLELTEMQHVLKVAEEVFDGGSTVTASNGAGGRGVSFSDDAPLLQMEAIPMDTFTPPKQDIPIDNNNGIENAPRQDSRISFLAGVVVRSKVFTFERVLWRSLRGNLVMRHQEIKEPITENILEPPVEKDVFIIFVQGAILQAKIRKICESFGATLYPCPDTMTDRHSLQSQISSRLQDLTSVLSKTNDHRRKILGVLASQLESAMQLVRQEKAIYNTLNEFNYDVTSKALVAEGWCPTKSLLDIQVALETAKERSQSLVSTVVHVLKTDESPPTFFRTNKFTLGFQTIVDAYGVARYREVNPTPFSIISFPFLFAVMFGDFGHGALMTAVAAYIVYYERKLKGPAKKNEIFGMLYGGRYIILLMGIFSIYTGLIYNDIFSKSMEAFGESAWIFEQVTNGTQEARHLDHTYPFGIDPAWHGTDNQLVFTNSYKMKMSVIFGVIQMSFGIFLSMFNHLHNNDKLSLFHEFVPQVLFLESIFGYLVITIIYKWCHAWTTTPPPSLLNMLINMFLSPGNIKSGEVLYSGQASFQLILLLIAVVCVPWMLLVKPLVLRHRHQARRASSAAYNNLHSGSHAADVLVVDDHESTNDGGDAHGHGDGHGHGEEFEFGEVFVHQTIHTIEFCLGCISNTASYLRLWALSLAHAQLSDVLWNMTIGQFYGFSGIAGGIGFFLAFGGWFALTIAILLIMEGLSAFLHALRLHWVEFNNKFYKGDGYKFYPFSFASLGETDEI